MRGFLYVPGRDSDTTTERASELVAGLEDDVTEQDQLELRYGEVRNVDLGQNPAEEESERSEEKSERVLHVVVVDDWRLLE